MTIVATAGKSLAPILTDSPHARRTFVMSVPPKTSCSAGGAWRLAWGVGRKREGRRGGGRTSPMSSVVALVRSRVPVSFVRWKAQFPILRLDPKVTEVMRVLS